jgi:hypothetical protein
MIFVQSEINQDKINKIYHQLEKKVSTEFIGWNIFNKNI